MPHCSNCGAAVEPGDAFCPNCGAAVASGTDGSPGRESRARPDRRREPTERSRQRPRDQQQGTGRRDRPPADDRRGAAPQGDPGRPGQPPDDPGQRESSGIDRRRLLAVGGVAAAGAAGWYLFLRETYPDTPTGVLEASWEAWREGDFERYDRLYHSESPVRESWDAEFRANFGPTEGESWTLEEREVVEQTVSEAVVREVYVFDSPDDDPVRITWTVQLRKEDGDWKIWETTVENAEPANGQSG